MGLTSSKNALDPGNAAVETAAAGPSRKRRGKKRKANVVEDPLAATPSKRRLKTTTEYIYETLFKDGKDSDVVVKALGRSWNLHKLYLGQSGYFSSMFSGSWRESEADSVSIDIADPNVTVAAFDTSLGSLYQDEVTIEPGEAAVSVLASATLLLLDGLTAQCVALMAETVNVRNVLAYLGAARMYGQRELEESCMCWLRVNLLSHVPEHPQRLADIDPELMATLVASPDLFVMQAEFSVYVLLRLWMFMRICKRHIGDTPQEAVIASHNYFQDLAKKNKKVGVDAFLRSPEGEQFTGVFRKLRLPQLVNHSMDMEMLVTDRIIPSPWMEPVFRGQWRNLLKMDHGSTEIGPNPNDVDEDTFLRNCLRCGRTLTNGGTKHVWRWTGFNHGLDLVVEYSNLNLTVKRNIPGQYNEHNALIATHPTRRLMYRATVASLNDQKQVCYTQTTGVKSATLGKNGTEHLLRLDRDKCKFPIVLSFNFMVCPPIPDHGDSDDRDGTEDDEDGNGNGGGGVGGGGVGGGGEVLNVVPAL